MWAMKAKMASIKMQLTALELYVKGFTAAGACIHLKQLMVKRDAKFAINERAKAHGSKRLGKGVAKPTCDHRCEGIICYPFR